MNIHTAACRTFSTLAVSTLLAVSAVQAAPENANPKAAVPVHHVRLTGTGFESMAADLFAHAVKFCTGMGKTPEPIPAGERVLGVEMDIYYAVGGVTTHTRTRNYLIDPQSCKLKRTEKIEIEMRTASGVCYIKPDLKRAAGHCDVRPLLTGRVEAVAGNPSIHATTRHLQIAGLECRIWTGEFRDAHIENCIASKGKFTGMTHSAHRGTPGLLLKSATWMNNDASKKTTAYEANAVAIDTTTTLDMLAPHVAGGYKVVQNGSPK